MIDIPYSRTKSNCFSLVNCQQNSDKFYQQILTNDEDLTKIYNDTMTLLENSS